MVAVGLAASQAVGGTMPVLRLRPPRQQGQMPRMRGGNRGKGRSMKRRRFTILSALSLLLFVVVVALCARSYRIEDHLTPRADLLISSQTGTLTLCHFP